MHALHRCSSCAEIKPRSAFHNNKSMNQGRHWSCKECRYWTEVKRKYGVDKKWFDMTLAEQGGACAICYTASPATHAGKGAAWHIDHDHVTGVVRGILCHHCNTALGGFKDDVDSLQRAIDYLRKI